MNEKTERTLNIWGQFSSIGAVVVSGVVAVMLLWNSATNVTKEEFVKYKDGQDAVNEAMKDTLAGINTSIQVITTKMENDQRQEKRLDEHESRIRSLELVPRR